jgi:hypothetical protein
MLRALTARQGCPLQAVSVYVFQGKGRKNPKEREPRKKVTPSPTQKIEGGAPSAIFGFVVKREFAAVILICSLVERLSYAIDQFVLHD